MPSNNAVNVSLSGQTGTGTFVGNLSPTFITPNIGAATATSVAFNPLTGGIVGTILVNNASAGFVGEHMGVNVTTPGVAVTTATPTNIMTLTLTPGDWDVKGNFLATFSAAAMTSVRCGINSVSATLPDQSLICAFEGTSATTDVGLVLPYRRFNVTVSTQIWIVATLVFSSGTANVSGNLAARRRR